MINIYIVDDHPLIREGFKKIISEEIDMSVVGEAYDGVDLIEKINHSNADILILDLKMPGKSGWTVLSELRVLYPDLLILVVTMLPEEQYAVRAIKEGANGFINKTTAINELIKGIRSVISRGKYINPRLANLLYQEIDKKSLAKAHQKLSNRELQILCLIAEGKKVREIADELYLSISTINTYRARIMSKMSLKTNVALTRYAMENKLI
jgi:two-component system, NarL family, invasion response regulator UvrY